jgi:CRP/FNR family transcriptional regulator
MDDELCRRKIMQADKLPGKTETSPVVKQLFEIYPDLAVDARPEWLELLDNAQKVEMPADMTLLSASDMCGGLMLLLEGSVRIYQLSEDGREITLYRINPGDICMMSLTSMIQGQPFKAYAKSETPSTALMVGTDAFRQAMAVSPAFRQRILSSLVNSVGEMMDTFYDTAFQTLDMRLACLLGRLFERTGTDTLNITHNDLAQELGTSREVISRLLKKLERNECLVLSRGQIRMGEKKELPGF